MKFLKFRITQKIRVSKKRAEEVILIILLMALAVSVYLWFFPPVTEDVTLYFTRGEMIVPVTRPVLQVRRKEEKLKSTVALLLAGPDRAEKTTGYDSALPSGAELLGVRIEGDTAFLDFSPQIEEGGGTSMMEARLRQIVYTATQFPGIERVSFLINGQPIKYFSGEGLTEVEKPVSRADLD
ncbi:MAG: GerMN domain-containing protein [Candidatus Omnitrophota bacterium]